MSSIINKEAFIKAAQNLQGSYQDYGLCLYSLAKQHGILNDTYQFMTTKAKNSDELDEEFYKLLGEPNPQVVIVDDLKREVATA